MGLLSLNTFFLNIEGEAKMRVRAKVKLMMRVSMLFKTKQAVRGDKKPVPYFLPISIR